MGLRKNKKRRVRDVEEDDYEGTPPPPLSAPRRSAAPRKGDADSRPHGHRRSTLRPADKKQKLAPKTSTGGLTNLVCGPFYTP